MVMPEGSALPIQRRRTSGPAVAAAGGALRASASTAPRPQELTSLSEDAAGPTFMGRRWADYTPTPGAEESKSIRLFRRASTGELPSMVFPPTPSPMDSPMKFANFGMPPMLTPTLPSLAENNTSGPPLHAPLIPPPPQQPPGMVMPGLPAGQLMYVGMPPMMMPMPPPGALPAGVQAGDVPPVQGYVAADAKGATQPPQPGAGERQDQQAATQLAHAAGRQLFSEAMDKDYLDNPWPGSAAHGTGRCNPCAWFWKPKQCQNGADCSYCHLCPEGELKNRKKAKVAALRMGAIEPAQAKAGAAGQQPAALKLTSLI